MFNASGLMPTQAPAGWTLTRRDASEHPEHFKAARGQGSCDNFSSDITHCENFCGIIYKGRSESFIEF